MRNSVEQTVVDSLLDQIIKDANKTLSTEFDNIMHELMTYYVINEGEHCPADATEHMFVMRGISGILKRLLNGELELRKVEVLNSTSKSVESLVDK